MVAVWEYSYNGLTFGGNTIYGVTGVDGLIDAPDIRLDELTVPGRHGGLTYADRYAMRRVTIQGDLVNFDETQIDALKAAFKGQVNDLPLVFDRPGFAADRRLYCKPAKLSMPLDMPFSRNYASWACQLVAQDPFIYADTQASVTLLAAATGLASNTGNFSHLFEQVRVTGPGTTFTVRINGSSTEQIVVNTTLTGGQYFDLNFQNRTIVKSDASNLYSSINQATSKWWELPVGSTTLQFVVGSGSTGATQAQFFYRSTWL